jgi:transglutaminase-like putative cysteine protease
VTILGSIRLSPSVRFTVESPEGRYWQTAAYDRYESSGWVRTGEAQAYTSRLSDPPGATTSIEQTVTPETELDAMPAAWKPVDVTGEGGEGVGVTPQGNLRPRETLQPGETYTVESQAPRYTSEQLRRAGDDYPVAVEQYLQLPESISQRVRDRSAAVAGNESNAYDKAVAIEEYLQSTKRYSLTVERPDGEIADSFLFEMDAGYCTYYATTMTVMLRSEGVPARFVTGYTTGQSVDDEYVVRGLDSHAWVQVYFPDVGWVNFDPTPSTPRETAENTRLTEARENNVAGVDTTASRPEGNPTPAPGNPAVTGNTSVTPQDPGVVGSPGEINTTNSNRSTPNLNRERLGLGAANATTASGSSGPSLPELPDRETLGFMLVVLVGLAAGARRTGLTRRAADALALRIQRGNDDPEAAVERAYERLETLLQQRHRARRPGETPRAYIEALSNRTYGIDDRAHRVADLYEQARYGQGVTDAEATRAVETVDELAWEATPVVGRVLTR